jgi:hypothetical protein
MSMIEALLTKYHHHLWEGSEEEDAHWNVKHEGTARQRVPFDVAICPLKIKHKHWYVWLLFFLKLLDVWVAI